MARRRSSDSDTDAIEYTFALGESLNVLNEATEHAAKSFGDFAASSNKGWTVLARLLSGSGLWRLQARIRAAGNIAELYFKNQEKMIRGQLKSVQSNIRVRESLEEMNQAYTDVKDNVLVTTEDINDITSKFYKKHQMLGKQKDPVLRMVLGDYKSAGFADALQRATKDTLGMYKSVMDGLDRTEEKRGKKLDKQIHGRIFSIKRVFKDVTEGKYKVKGLTKETKTVKKRFQPMRKKVTKDYRTYQKDKLSFTGDALKLMKVHRTTKQPWSGRSTHKRVPVESMARRVFSEFTRMEGFGNIKGETEQKKLAEIKADKLNKSIRETFKKTGRVFEVLNEQGKALDTDKGPLLAIASKIGDFTKIKEDAEVKTKALIEDRMKSNTKRNQREVERTKNKLKKSDVMPDVWMRAQNRERKLPDYESDEKSRRAHAEKQIKAEMKLKADAGMKAFKEQEQTRRIEERVPMWERGGDNAWVGFADLIDKSEDMIKHLELTNERSKVKDRDSGFVPIIETPLWIKDLQGGMKSLQSRFSKKKKDDDEEEEQSDFGNFWDAVDEQQKKVIDAGMFSWGKVFKTEFSAAFKKIPILGKAGTKLYELANFGWKNRKLSKEAEIAEIEGWKNAINENERVKKIKDWASGKSKKDIMKAVGSAMMKFMIWMIVLSTGLFLLIMIGRKAWPAFRKYIEFFSGVFTSLWGNIEGLLKGIFHLVEAVMAGDFWMFLKVLFKEVLYNLAMVILKGIAAVVVILASLWAALMVGLFRAIKSMAKDIWAGFKGWAGFASGGSAQNWTVVGEKGPELVNVGRASHIYSNQQSEQMMGGQTNNVTVQVQGRIGASDAEVKDMADKIGREINMRINRSGSSSVGFG